MKTLIITSVFCFIAFINSYSQTKQESIKELFIIMKQDSMIEKTFSSMLPSMINQLQGQIKDSTSRAHSKEMMNSSFQTLKEIMEKLINEDMVIIYDRYFSQNEINDFISFYKSPSGQKFINVTPDIQKDVMMVMMQKYLPELQKSMKAKMEELKNNSQK
jgi:uncharacterized protein